MRRSGMLGLMVVGLLAGCAGADWKSTEEAGGGSVAVRLSATRVNTGEIGLAMLTPLRDGTGVTVEVSGVPSPSTRPVHLYTYIHEGTCDALNPTPAYTLTDRVLAESLNTFPMAASAGPPLKVSNTAPVPLATLRSRPNAIVVRSAPADGNRAIFCGDIDSRGTTASP
ncbi:MAG: hypothetical protein ROZ37_12050 [Aromatoleum sp.]|uniref:hypothetical protein n=1 Tax=Aromatoleum sp. TaxID=2307007 RepID=UPI0028938D5C|nr:hypothetical protein [Aromatoleum sp.]MDT3671051.1 hypothetical protein [Aromatoleum sp.]